MYDLQLQADNFQAETSGAPDGEYNLTKFEYSSSSLGRGKYTGLCLIVDGYVLLNSHTFIEYRNWKQHTHRHTLKHIKSFSQLIDSTRVGTG